MKVTVIGTGYVGLVQGACLASLGHNVVCVDVDNTKVANLRAGSVPFFEPGLENLVHEGMSVSMLKFTTSLREAMLERPDLIFLAVGTPQSDDGSCDLRYLEAASREISEALQASDEPIEPIVVIKSTVPPGTCEHVEKWIGLPGIDVASNPEFLREGRAVEDFFNPERTVIGVKSHRAEESLRQLYGQIEAPLLVMSPASAQLSKYAANTFLASRLSLINEIANIADSVGADIKDVEAALGSDSRIGQKFLRAGAGFGGSCFPKDVMALDYCARSLGYEPKLIRPIIEVNHEQISRFVEKIKLRLGGVNGRRLAAWGLSFNKDTDDTRESPAIKIIASLVEMGAEVHVFDPRGMKNARSQLGDSVVYSPSAMDALPGAEALLVLTEWDEFALSSWDQIGKILSRRLIFDGKNFLPHSDLRALGFEVIGIGLNTVCRGDL